jgi:hypothetical protein
MKFPLEDASSDNLEKSTHAFLIRIWKEEPGSDDHPAVWRGHITHAYTGKRLLFQDLDDVLGFIEAYLNV